MRVLSELNSKVYTREIERDTSVQEEHKKCKNKLVKKQRGIK